MRIGVICEGPSDYHAIESFFGHSLGEAGVRTEFKALQPQMDRTQPEAGWGNVLLWLKKNPPATRIQSYFGGGLFGGSLATEPFDCLLIQIDSDILGDAAFAKFVSDNYGIILNNPQTPDQRASAIRCILQNASQFQDMTSADVARHLLAPAVESTEAWCVAAFTVPTINFESLAGQALVDAFMTVIEKSEGRQPQAGYAKIDKSPKRREKFCKQHSNGSARIVAGCAQFGAVHNQLVSLAQSC
ncbi:MAG: hypothetical protein ABL928_06195 [Sphingorhabdus sp.]